MHPRMSFSARLLMVTCVLTLSGATAASASTFTLADGDSSVSISGPVGIVAIACGIAGLLVGLLRLRKRETQVTVDVETRADIPRQQSAPRQRPVSGSHRA